jgi:endonuclease G
MTNIVPQAADNNQRSWATLENYCRTLASQGNELHIVAGVAGTGGTGKNGYKTTIDGGNITVPDSFWKVILVQPNGTNDVGRVTTSTRVIAVNIPNDQGIGTNWASYRTTVDYIENITGLDLFENINNSTESYLESRVDNGPTN